MKKGITTISSYTLAVILQFVCLRLAKNSIEKYESSFSYWVRKIFTPNKITNGESTFFSIDRWREFNIAYYNKTELNTFITFFTILLFLHLALSGHRLATNHPKVKSVIKIAYLVLLLFCGYIIIYELFAIILEIFMLI